jgi:4,5-dihydroxyphthalate decarboxylase
METGPLPFAPVVSAVWKTDPFLGDPLMNEPVEKQREGTESRRGFLKTTALAGAALAGGAAGRSEVGEKSAPTSGKLPLRIAGYDYDRVKGLMDGSVRVEGCDVRFVESNIYELNANALGGKKTWEVTEVGLHPFLLAYANDAFRDYTLIPVFPLRTFRHKSIFIRTDRGIETPRDLRGKTVAAAGYSQSSLTWIRGFLRHEYGVKPEEMRWVISARSSDKGKVSKNESRLPRGVPIRPGPKGKDEGELLAAGEVDAVFSAIEPKVYQEGHPKVARLFPDYRKTERAYYAKTGIFPIMHAVAIRCDMVKKHPRLPGAVFRAYSQAKELMYQDLQKSGWYKISLPWIEQELAETRKLMGANYWPYGIAPNRKAIEALFQYSHEQGLAKRKLTIKELFHPSTLDLEEKISP